MNCKWKYRNVEIEIVSQKTYEKKCNVIDYKRWVTKHGQKMKNVSIHEFLIEFLCSLIIWIQARNFFVKNVFLFFSYNMSVRCFDSVDFFFKIFKIKVNIKIIKNKTNAIYPSKFTL